MIRSTRDILLQLGQLQQLLATDLCRQLTDHHNMLGDGAGQLLELRIGFDKVAHVRYALHLLLALGADLEVVHQRFDRLADFTEVRVDVLK